MAPTTVPSANKPAMLVYSKIPGARCIEIIHHIDDLSDLRRHPARSVQHPGQFEHLQNLARTFGAFKAELLAEFDEPLKTIACQPVSELTKTADGKIAYPQLTDADVTDTEVTETETTDIEALVTELQTLTTENETLVTEFDKRFYGVKITDTESTDDESTGVESTGVESTDIESDPETTLTDLEFSDLIEAGNAELDDKLAKVRAQLTEMSRPMIPGLATNGLPVQGEGDASATASPARGKAMKEALLSKLRPPPLEHTWEFWHDRQGRESKPAWAQAEEQKQAQQSGSDPDSPTDKVNESNEYESRLVKLHVMSDLRQFWETMNHFDMSSLRLRDSVHLFHLGVKPVWEDPRNVKGGAWTFRVPKEKAPQFWKEVSMMAVGGELQSAVDNSAKRNAFIDDICGISYSVRFNSHLISIWNRDAGNQEGIDRLRDTILGGISDDLQIRENQVYYKRHSEHAGFRFPDPSEQQK
ncbi:hypothetical protein SLS55_002555 [Diplodia seriata]|uniref:Eukaryotic translation initiation factor 4E type 3 n=1 Tax=Diplodia seriata TaxID=420778 RepID=A0ABR3CVI8_9PEZI